MDLSKIMDRSDVKSNVRNPARFTHSHASTNDEMPFAVIILNQPIEDKAMLVDVCSRGRFRVEAASRSLLWLI